jgi:thioredoxin-dependent peroxiredoxin
VEALEFSELKPKFERLGAVVLGVSPDSVDSHRKFTRKNKIAVTLLSDADTSVP